MCSWGIKRDQWREMGFATFNHFLFLDRLTSLKQRPPMAILPLGMCYIDVDIALLF